MFSNLSTPAVALANFAPTWRALLTSSLLNGFPNIKKRTLEGFLRLS